MKQYFKTLLTILLISTLTACGGKGEAPQTPPQSTNQAPIAASDSVTTKNNAEVLINVLSNDSDADGDTLSVSEITSQPSNGSAELDGNTIRYTPNANYIGEDILSYSISDGELSSTANVTVQSSQTITLSGVVTDSPLAEAQVAIVVNGEQFDTLTNAVGEYSIEIPLTNFDGYAIVTATGSGSQSQVTLTSFLGSVANLITSAPENRIINEEANSSVKVTQLTTARLLLARFYNLDNVSENTEDFAQLIDRDNASELIELAAFINLIVDYPNYVLAENQSLAMFFAPQTQYSPRQLINNYLRAPAFLDIFGRQLEQVSQDFDDALISSGNQNVIAYSAEELIGQTLAFTIGDLQLGILPNETDLYSFETAMNGTYYRANSIVGSIEYPFTWQVIEGKIEITFHEEDSIGSDSFPNYSPGEVTRFGEEAVAKAAEIDSTVGFPSGQLYIKQLPSDQLLSRFGRSEGGAFAIRVQTEKEILRLNDNVQDFFYEHPITNVVSSIELESNFVFDTSAEAMTGDWLLHFEYEFLPVVDVEVESFDNVEPKLNVDQVTFMPSGEATSEISGLTFNWSANNNGSFEFSDETNRYVVTPLFENENGYLAKYQRFTNQQKTSTFVKKLYKADDIANFDVSSLSTTYPISYVSLIEAGSQGGFENGLVNPEYVFAYQFNTNTVDRLRGYDADNDPNVTDIFISDWSGRKVIQDSLTLKLSVIQRSLYIERTWKIFKITEQRVWFMRSQFFLRDIGTDGSYGSAFVSLAPILSSALKTDLSKYTEIWNRTLEQGMLNP